MSNEELSNVIDRAEDEYQKLKDKVIEQSLEIERLNKENEELKKIQCPFLGTGCKAEIEKLNNIINEMEKELKEDYKIWMCNSRSNGKSVKFGIDVCKTHFYNRLQKLKEEGNNNE